MSCIASAVSRRRASGSTLQEGASRPPRTSRLPRWSPAGTACRPGRWAAGRSSGSRVRTHGCTIVVHARRVVGCRLTAAPRASGRSSGQRACHTASVTTAPRKGTRVRPAPTLEDLAARAGVSRATASRVLRGDSKVSEHAREAVLEAARAISYVPNLAARSLVTGRSDSVAFLVEETEERMFADPFFLGMLRSAQEAVGGRRPAAGVHGREPTGGPGALPRLRRRRPRRRRAAALAARPGPAAPAPGGARRTDRAERSSAERAPPAVVRRRRQRRRRPPRDRAPARLGSPARSRR